jgi:hypothetical protein
MVAAIVAILIVALAGIGYLLWPSDRREVDTAETKQAPTLKDYAEADRHFREENAGSAEGKVISKVTSRQIFVRDLFATDPRLIALSAAEAAWLDRHYYPTPKDLEGLASLDTNAIRGTRDPKLATLQGLALVEQKQISAATAVLMGAAAMGSIYASEEGAVAERQLVRERLGSGNAQLDAVYRARLEVARVLGDHTVQYLIDRDMPDFDMSAHGADVQRHTTEFLRQLGDDAKLRGLAAPGIDPRPNGAQWMDLYTLNQAGGGGDSVTIYERN